MPPFIFSPDFTSRLRRFGAAASRGLFSYQVIGCGLLGVFLVGCQPSVLWNDLQFGSQPEDLRDSSRSPDRQPSSQGGLKLGAMLPVVGDLGQIGRPMLQTLPLLVDTVNRCGGVNNAFVSLVVEDQATKPIEGAVTLTKLSEADRVSAIVGAFSSDVSTAALPVAVRDKVLLISPASTSPTLTDRAQKGTYKGFWARTVPSDRQEAVALAQLAQKRGFRTVTTITVNNPDAVALERAFVAAFEKRGGTVLDKTQPLRYDLNADPSTLEDTAYTAFRPFDPPDAVIAILDRSVGALLLKSAAELGFTQGVPVVLTDEVRTDAFVQRVGKTEDGISLMAGAIGIAPSADSPAFADLNKLWQSQFGSPPGLFVAQTWDAAALVMLAAQAAKSNTREGIQAKLRDVANPPGVTVNHVCEGLALLRDGKEINYEGVSGKVDIDRAGDVKGDYEVWTVDEKGQLRRVDRIRPET
jgi:neutral amino acid transport system substrate-binding protein